MSTPRLFLIATAAAVIGLVGWAKGAEAAEGQWLAKADSSTTRRCGNQRNPYVGPGTGCYFFASPTVNGNTPVIRVAAATAKICVNTDTTAAAIGTATYQIYQVDTELAADANTSESTAVGPVLTGAGGAAGTQKACETVGPGLYWLQEVDDTDPGAGEIVLIYIKGYEAVGR